MQFKINFIVNTWIIQYSSRIGLDRLSEHQLTVDYASLDKWRKSVRFLLTDRAKQLRRSLTIVWNWVTNIFEISLKIKISEIDYCKIILTRFYSCSNHYEMSKIIRGHKFKSVNFNLENQFKLDLNESWFADDCGSENPDFLIWDKKDSYTGSEFKAWVKLWSIWGRKAKMSWLLIRKSPMLIIIYTHSPWLLSFMPELHGQERANAVMSCTLDPKIQFFENQGFLTSNRSHHWWPDGANNLRSRAVGLGSYNFMAFISFWTPYYLYLGPYYEPYIEI